VFHTALWPHCPNKNDCMMSPHLGDVMLVLHESVILMCRYKQEFGFVIPGRKILVDDVRIRGIGRTHVHMEQTIPSASGEPVSEMVKCRRPLLSPSSRFFSNLHKCMVE